MRKSLIEKIKIGLVALGLTSGLSFETMKAQTNPDYKVNYENKNLQSTIYQAKEDSILENILNDFLGKYIVDTLYLENPYENNRIDTLIDTTPTNYFKNIYNNEFYNDDSRNKTWIWENRELAKWLQNLGEKKRDSLKKSILKKNGKVTFSGLENFRKRLDKNYPKKPVKVPGTDSYFIPTPNKNYTIFVEKEEENATIWDIDKINKNPQSTIYQTKEDSILENILKDFLGEYRIDTLHLDHLNLDGSFTDTFEVHKTTINYFKYDPLHDDEHNLSHIRLNKETAKWLQNLGEEKRDSLKKSILEKKKKIDFFDLNTLRQRLDKNYPKFSLEVPRTNLYFVPRKNDANMLNIDEIIKELNKYFRLEDD